ncbi:MAG: hypothetical protein HY691_12090 [Chloroflexi bacterium]|nr:hypothetical protein [Chloroflexota bacterium]
MIADAIQIMGLLASMYLLVALLMLSLALVVALLAASRLLGYGHRRLAGAFGKARGAALGLERGVARSARVAAAPIVFGRRVRATGRALWRRAAGPLRAWRGAR